MTTSMTPPAPPASTYTRTLQSWIAANYPNLHVESLCKSVFQTAAQQAAQLDNSQSPSTQAEKEEIETTLQGAIFIRPFANDMLLEAVRQDFELLADNASQPDLPGQMCRDFLGLLLAADGEPVIAELRSWAKVRSCEVLLGLAQQGLFVPQVAYHVFAALARTSTVESELRHKLLLVFDSIAESSHPPSLESLAQTLKTALELEVSRLPAEIDESMAVAILDRILRYPHPEIYPLLDALIHMEGLRATRKHAKLVLDELKTSPENIWHETSPDLVSSLEERSHILQRINNKNLRDKEAAQVIVYTFKENLMETESDPRLKQLISALDGPASLVRLTASFTALIQAEQKLIPDHAQPFSTLLENTARALSEMAMDTEDSRAGAQAIVLLSRLEKVSPKLEKLVSEAKMTASMRFIEKEHTTG